MEKEKDPRIITPIPTALLEAIDDFRFEKRLASRAEAIRHLIKRGLDAAGQESDGRSKPGATLDESGPPDASEKTAEPEGRAAPEEPSPKKPRRDKSPR